jgi:DnaJ-class molecular chaperone
MAVETRYYEILEVETDASDHEIKRVSHNIIVFKNPPKF